MTMRVSPLTPTFGARIEGHGDLAELSQNEVEQLFADYGVLWFQGYCSSPYSFETFTQTLAKDFIHHGNPNRLAQPGDGFTITVTPGGDQISLHSEFGYSPFRPAVIWFYCAQPAQEGGGTVICDGRAVFDSMQPFLQEIFSHRKITYLYRDITKWSRFLLTQDDGLPVAANQPGSAHTVDSHGALLQFSYTTSALRRDIAQRYAFACSLLDWGFSFEDAVFEDGTLIDPQWVSDLRELSWSLARRIRMQANDVLMIDNSRFMHGREPYSDAKRRHFLRMARQLTSKY